MDQVKTSEKRWGLILLVAAAPLFLNSCFIFGGGDEEPEADRINYSQVSQPVLDPSEINSSGGAGSSGGADARGLYLLTPEQFSRAIEDRLDYQYGWEDGNGEFFNAITGLFAVPLGGVDFRTASRRDSSPKVQTQLLIRFLAWRIAGEVVWREANPDSSEPKTIFTAVNIREDRPFKDGDADLPAGVQEDIREGESRWEEQLGILYRRLYSRAPTADEVVAVKAGFLAVVDAYDGWPPSGWIGVLYAMLSSTEFWNA